MPAEGNSVVMKGNFGRGISRTQPESGYHQSVLLQNQLDEVSIEKIAVARLRDQLKITGNQGAAKSKLKEMRGSAARETNSPDNRHQRQFLRSAATSDAKSTGICITNTESTDSSTRRKIHLLDKFFTDYYQQVSVSREQRRERLEELKRQAYKEHCSPAEYQRRFRQFCSEESAKLRRRRQRYTSAQYTHITQIGQGGYGSVHLVRSIHGGQVCAMKKIEKRTLLRMNEVDHILTERDLLAELQSPWLVRLHSAFQDDSNLYLLMEYVPGGDFRTFMNRSGILRDSDARFYAAEMFAAINELHRLGYIHRDCKPENFLLDASGHVKLTDFGLAASGRVDPLMQYIGCPAVDPSSTGPQSRAYSLVGSPDYLAPELLQNSDYLSREGGPLVHGYDYLVDYWSLGCIIFEFLVGYPPFTADSITRVWRNVYHWEETLVRPHYEGEDAEFNLTDEAWSLVTSLIAHRHRRLPNYDSVQKHPWFLPLNECLERCMAFKGPATSIANRPPRPRPIARVGEDLWRQLRNFQPALAGPFVEADLTIIRPPYVPEINSDADPSHFDDFSSGVDAEIYQQVLERHGRLNNPLDSAPKEPLTRQERNRFRQFTYHQWDNVNPIQ